MSTLALDVPLQILRRSLLPHLNAVLSASAAIFGIAGTAWLAVDPTQVAGVFALYMASSTAWIGVAALTRQPWLLCCNVIYFGLALKALLF